MWGREETNALECLTKLRMQQLRSRPDPPPVPHPQELAPTRYLPTLTHHFLRLLHDKCVLRRCYTQNIDSLEVKAGLPADAVVAAHGNFDSAHCIDCGATAPLEDMHAAIEAAEVRERCAISCVAGTNPHVRSMQLPNTQSRPNP